MEEELMFRIIFVVTFSIFAVVRIYFRSKTIGRESEKEESLLDKPEGFLSVVIIAFFIMIFLYLVFPNLVFWAHLDFPIFIRWSGLILDIISILLLIWIHQTLGKQYSAKLEIQMEHVLIETGPYKKIRHPMYTVFMSFTLGLAILSSNAIMFILAILIAIPFHWITKKEERMLTEQFGEEYKSYMKRTGRFIPSFQRKD
ncbi:MAG: methyltransferase [Promethearchaeota archaeon]